MQRLKVLRFWKRSSAVDGRGVREEAMVGKGMRLCVDGVHG